eukprot:TRINITY_DN9516_c0_g1_i1.p1 TRINITY_DN9516_c0_g1~~TRINITY_DN9516_c0_g1_i1.p1  ORF type:complete len:236 (+),score=42.67 TRINITY_DN9516_c0_g1_i1:131-838(+)
MTILWTQSFSGSEDHLSEEGNCALMEILSTRSPDIRGIFRKHNINIVNEKLLIYPLRTPLWLGLAGELQKRFLDLSKKAYFRSYIESLPKSSDNITDLSEIKDNMINVFRSFVEFLTGKPTHPSIWGKVAQIFRQKKSVRAIAHLKLLTLNSTKVRDLERDLSVFFSTLNANSINHERYKYDSVSNENTSLSTSSGKRKRSDSEMSDDETTPKKKKETKMKKQIKEQKLNKNKKG